MPPFVDRGRDLVLHEQTCTTHFACTENIWEYIDGLSSIAARPARIMRTPTPREENGKLLRVRIHPAAVSSYPTMLCSEHPRK